MWKNRRWVGSPARAAIGPCVLPGDVVEHEVEAQADPVAAQHRCQLAEIIGRAEVGADRAVVGDGVPAVVGRRGAAAAAA